jgi:hypothetical protein
MNKSTLVFVALIITVGVAATALHSKNAESQQNDNRAIDKTSFPLIDYSTASEKGKSGNASDQHKRTVRGKKYDKSDLRVHPDDPAEDTVITDVMDPNLPALPVDQSTVILVGDVMSAEAYLSNNQSGIYSEFTIQAVEILKNRSTESLVINCSIDAEREGGRVRFPSGKIHWYGVNKQNLPLINHRYVLFLKRDMPEEAFHIVTAYELRGNKVYSLDELSQFRAHEGQDQADFMRSLQSRIANEVSK